MTTTSPTSNENIRNDSVSAPAALLPARTVQGRLLEIGVLAGQNEASRIIAIEPVYQHDLRIVREETWWCGVLAGRLSSDLRGCEASVWPGEDTTADRLNGFLIEVTDGRGTFRRWFPITALQHVAQRPVGRLLQEKAIADDEPITFYLTERLPCASPAAGDVRPAGGPPGANMATSPAAVVEPNGGPSRAAADSRREGSTPEETAACVFRFDDQSEPIRFQEVSLRDYLDRSQLWTGPQPPTDSPSPSRSADLPETDAESDRMPIVFTEDAWRQAHQWARRGGQDESAGVFLGRLCRDPDSRQIALLIDDCLPAPHAAATERSVEFSGDTWGELRRQLRQRRKRMGRAEDMIVGSVHGHNFGPALDEAGRKTCAVCSQRSACNRTTAVASLADIKWHFSVFAGQPWAILLVWGWNARDQEQWRVYGLESGTLMPRPIRLLPSSVAQLAAAERSQIG